jgi:hypothetical protein
VAQVVGLTAHQQVVPVETVPTDVVEVVVEVELPLEQEVVVVTD